jgi:hypothetical protein
MSDNPARLAERALVSICAHIALMPCRDRDVLDTWLQCLADVLPYCTGCSQRVQPLFKAAENLLRADSGHNRRNRLTRLQYDVSLYFGIAAGISYEAFQSADMGEVVA